MEAKAKELQNRGLAVLSSKGAALLPYNVRALIADLLAFIVELSKERGGNG